MKKEVGMSKVPENGGIHHRRRQGRGRRHIHQQNIFLPMFCRLSIKDVKLNQTKDRSNNVPKPATISISTSTATGQVRRNKIVFGFPTTTASAAAVTRLTPTSRQQQPPKSQQEHERMRCETLVGKAAAITTSTFNSAVGVSSSGGGSGGNRCGPGRGDMSLNYCKRSQVTKNDHADSNDQDCHVKAVIGSISEMDPPLPVVKRVALPGAGGDEVNIWRRRFNGVALKSLQIQHQIISPT